MKLHHKLEKALGYKLIKTRKLNDTLEQNLKNVFQIQKINCVIDVGANRGQYGQSLRDSGYTGRIVSFEPVSSIYSLLQDTCLGDDNWRTYQLALGSEHTTQAINVCKASSFTSFYSPTEYATKRFARKVETADCEDVEIRTLDSMWPEVVNGLKKPCVYLKLDTQGYDLEVLKGAKCSLSCVLGMQSEISLKAIYEGMPDYLTALAEFRNLGFEITGFYPISRDKKTLAVIEYDCILIRSTNNEA